MKREFLEGLELEKDMIDLIMAEHGKTVQTYKASLEETQGVVEAQKEQLQQRDEDLQKLKDKDVTLEDLQKQVQEYEDKYQTQQQEYDSKITGIKKMSEIKLGVTQAGAKNLKAVIALLEPDDIELTDDGIKGLSEQIEELKKSDAYLFDPDREPSGQAVGGGNPNRGEHKPSDAFSQAVEKFTR